jgi:hypothetical protein
MAMNMNQMGMCKVAAAVAMIIIGIAAWLLPSFAHAEYGDVVMNNYSDKAGVRPVVFPHWFHRARFTCKVCHADLGFKFKAGGNEINMLKIIDGQYSQRRYRLVGRELQPVPFRKARHADAGARNGDATDAPGGSVRGECRRPHRGGSHYAGKEIGRGDESIRKVFPTRLALADRRCCARVMGNGK